MKAADVLQQYAEGRRDFRGEDLRGQNFRGKDLSGADFSQCDIRGTNFKEACQQGLLEAMKSNPIGAFVAGAIEGWKA